MNNEILDFIRHNYDNNFDENTPLQDIAGDSLDLLDLVFRLEENFDVRLEDKELLNIKKLSDLFSLISDKDQHV